MPAGYFTCCRRCAAASAQLGTASGTGGPEECFRRCHNRDRGLPACPRARRRDGRPAGGVSAPVRWYVAGISVRARSRTSRNLRSEVLRQAPPLRLPNRRCPGVWERRNRGPRGAWVLGSAGTDELPCPTAACCCSDTARTHSGPCMGSRRTGTCSQGSCPTLRDHPHCLSCRRGYGRADACRGGRRNGWPRCVWFLPAGSRL